LCRERPYNTAEGTRATAVLAAMIHVNGSI
jgi:hypothetical protein